MQVFVNFIMDGLNLGSVYALVALGYTMVYGIAKCLTLPTAMSLWWAVTRFT